MAGWEHTLPHRVWVQTREHETARGGPIPSLDHLNQPRNLIETLPGVVGARAAVLGAKVTPVEAVYRSQIVLGAFDTKAAPIQEFAVTVGLPDLDTVVQQQSSVGLPTKEELELLKDDPERHSLGGKEWQSVTHLVHHWRRGKDRQRAGTRAVVG